MVSEEAFYLLDKSKILLNLELINSTVDLLLVALIYNIAWTSRVGKDNFCYLIDCAQFNNTV